ncbi:hypothetical protein CsNV_037 [Callinectes sapidus nudivirus]|nr:hypothetical protein CsNV_037 [Callinectes sapidus nudivirus]
MSLLTSLSSSTNAADADQFLELYVKEKLQDATNLGVSPALAAFNSSTDDPENLDIFPLFQKTINTIECDKNCLPNVESMIKYPTPTLETFKSFDSSCKFKFSLFDITAHSNLAEVQKIKYIMGDHYARILVNTYKYQMMTDFYLSLGIPQTIINTLYKLFIITVKSVVGDVEVFDAGSLTLSDIDLIIDNIGRLPTYEFCKTWMEMHELACIFENVTTRKSVLYNHEMYKPQIYIHFEFHSKFLVILKSSMLVEQ